MKTIILLLIILTSYTVESSISPAIKLIIAPKILFKCIPLTLGGGCNGIDASLKVLSPLTSDSTIKLSNITLGFSNELEFTELNQNDELFIPMMHVYDKQEDNLRIKTLYLHPGLNIIRLQILKDDKQYYIKDIKIQTYIQFRKMPQFL